MEKKVDYKIILIGIIIIIMLVLSGYKVIKNREKHLYEVLYNKIKASAKECFLKNDCEGTITLNDLYEKNYLKVQYDPITKEQLHKNIKIEYKEDEIIIDN